MPRPTRPRSTAKVATAIARQTRIRPLESQSPRVIPSRPAPGRSSPAASPTIADEASTRGAREVGSSRPRGLGGHRQTEQIAADEDLTPARGDRHDGSGVVPDPDAPAED